MARRIRLLTLQAGQDVELLDGEVLRVLKAEYVKTTNYQQQYNTSPYGSTTGTITYQPTGEYSGWQILVVTGPAESVEEIEKAMFRTPQSAP